ncbi:cobalt-factor II C(20)-methyltransferase [Halobiforma nitratireducens]|uniref:Cobalt-precorrin-2 C(20)-methyltransferase n=1 Tax=Halobiforma nitratireducens JCM 10879 TaxID=1227454 RepID=M0MDW8_9EURY|nr:cobalt-factor II C(20)-methyltransferase [Halobiforma nitratireducens]EMA42595.1 cobalt-precorrin-2 C(20)-methyltransferase [Halobiforma nitratireducens JCM 10879]
MTVYGVGLGPGDADLVTVRGKAVLENASVVYSPGRLSRSVALEHVDESAIGDLEFPMTRDEQKLRNAWKEAAAEVATAAAEDDVAFVTLGDPNVYSTFGHLRRTLATFHPDVDLEVVPGVSAVTAFATALGVEVEAGAGLALREADGGASPTGPDRLILFKVTDAPATHEGLVDAGYEVTYGRRLFMEQGETVVTHDPDEIAERDYYTLAYAERADLEVEPATAAFEVDDDGSGTRAESEREAGPAATGPDSPAASTDDRAAPEADVSTDSKPDERRSESPADVSLERAEGLESGDCDRDRDWY